MNIQGTYTNKGLALTAKTAAGACLRVTRVVGGSGHTADVPNAAQLPEIRQTLAVGEARCAGNTAVLPVTLAAVELGATYTLTELGVYAEDPNEGEILYCVYRLDEPVTIQAGSDTVLRFYLRQTVSKDGGAEVLCSPAAAVWTTDCTIVGLRNLTGVRATDSSLVSLISSSVTGCTYALETTTSSIAALAHTSGAGYADNVTGVYAYNGGIAIFGPQIPDLLGGTSNRKKGGAIVREDGTLL